MRQKRAVSIISNCGLSPIDPAGKLERASSQAQPSTSLPAASRFRQYSGYLVRMRALFTDISLLHGRFSRLATIWSNRR